MNKIKHKILLKIASNDLPSSTKASFSLFDDSFEPSFTPQVTNLVQQQAAPRPPPLPPMLPTTTSSSAFIPSRPAPPPVPPMISNAQRANTLSNSQNSSANSLTGLSNNATKAINDLDLLGDPGESPPPLPMRTNQ